MAPEIICSIFEVAKRPMRVLDPMMGSGTVIALAQSRKHQAIGIDIDPLAALMASAWTTPVEKKLVLARAVQVLNSARRVFRATKASDSFPQAADPATRAFIRYWFDCQSRRQLQGLSLAIGRIRERPIRNLLWCAFSRLIISKKGASRALDLVHSRPHRHFKRAPVLPFSKFLSVVTVVLDNVPPKSGRDCGPRTVVRLGDARKTGIKGESVDLVLTSPPYLNAIDYMRCSKFSFLCSQCKDHSTSRRARWLTPSANISASTSCQPKVSAATYRG
jgi:hypothetical protein